MMRLLLALLLALLPGLSMAAPLTFTIGTSEPVVVDTTGGTPLIWLYFGGDEVRAATYRSGSGTAALEFAYDIAAGDFAPSGIVAAGQIELAGGAIRDLAGNPLTLSFTPPDLSGVRVRTYRPVWTTDPITAANASAAAFEITKAPLGASFAWEITSDGGGSLSGSGTIASAPHPVTGIDLSSLGDGTLTLSLTLTTAAGTSAPRTVTVVKEAAWTPAELPALALWLDGADLDGDGAAEGLEEGGQAGGVVSAWADKSGSGRSVAQATAANRPTLRLDGVGGVPAVFFDGNDMLTGAPGIFATSDLITVAIVATFEDTTSRRQLFEFGPTTACCNHFYIEQNTYNTAGSRYGLYASSTAFDSSVPTSAGPKLFTLISDTRAGNAVVANTAYHVDGMLASLVVRAGWNTYAGFSAFTSFGIGAGGFWHGMHHGQIAEIVVSNTLASTAERQKLEGYLAHKWGLAGSLPAGHPWKAVAP
jgi:hypothetical protein